MMPAPLPSNERQRIATLRSLKILDTPPEERFDRVTRLARRVFNVPIALVSLVDEERQWFKSCQGLEVSETPRGISFCGHAIMRDDPLIVPDALEDERFQDNPMVTGTPNIRFYAGYPLNAPDGSKLGSLCIIDRKPRRVSSEDVNALATLGRLIESELRSVNLATVDEITGLHNYRGMLDTGRHALALAVRLGHSAELLVLRVPRVREIYDKRGVSEGERVLVEVAQAVLACFEPSDLVSRIGDNEFGVLLIGREPIRTAPALRRLGNLLEELNERREPELQITAKLATATYDAKRHTSLQDLITDTEKRLA
jgi:diguanylate cyclase (GGDEF)-like protein